MRIRTISLFIVSIFSLSICAMEYGFDDVQLMSTIQFGITNIIDESNNTQECYIATLKDGSTFYATYFLDGSMKHTILCEWHFPQNNRKDPAHGPSIDKLPVHRRYFTLLKEKYLQQKKKKATS